MRNSNHIYTIRLGRNWNNLRIRLFLVSLLQKNYGLTMFKMLELSRL